VRTDLGVREFTNRAAQELLLVGQAQIHPVENNRVLRIWRISQVKAWRIWSVRDYGSSAQTPIRMVMKRTLLVGLLAIAGVLGRPAPASADVTFFLGFSPTPDYRMTRGIAAGINMLVVGFEFDYSYTGPDETNGVPSLRTGMMNVLVMTPTKTQLYATAGGGAFRESLNGVGKTNFGTNIGGGVKLSLFGSGAAEARLSDLQPARGPFGISAAAFLRRAQHVVLNMSSAA
jgi:hypothetical protein